MPSCLATWRVGGPSAVCPSPSSSPFCFPPPNFIARSHIPPICLHLHSFSCPSPALVALTHDDLKPCSEMLATLPLLLLLTILFSPSVPQSLLALTLYHSHPSLYTTPLSLAPS